MGQSALEIEARRLVQVAADYVREGDRAVVIALVLSLVPFPIANIFSLIISLLNILLIWSGKLPSRHLKTVLATMMLACASIWLFFYLFGHLQHGLLTQAQLMLQWLGDALSNGVDRQLHRIWV